MVKMAVNTGSRITECKVVRRFGDVYLIGLRDLGASETPVTPIRKTFTGGSGVGWITNELGLMARTGPHAKTYPMGLVSGVH